MYTTQWINTGSPRITVVIRLLYSTSELRT